MNRCPRVQMLKEPAPRIRWITREQTAGLVGELPEHQQAMTQFALETGLRRRSTCCRNWGDGRRRRWCSGMRTSPPSTWRTGWTAAVAFGR
jgi:hypothetical protein